jgi:hypothetical protein
MVSRVEVWQMSKLLRFCTDDVEWFRNQIDVEGLCHKGYTVNVGSTNYQIIPRLQHGFKVILGLAEIQEYLKTL